MKRNENYGAGAPPRIRPKVGIQWPRTTVMREFAREVLGGTRSLGPDFWTWVMEADRHCLDCARARVLARLSSYRQPQLAPRHVDDEDRNQVG